ncbi:MAG TPA: hypothetical protein VEI99_04465 [Terriglobales bacterium]|nr:hypothetical protein [Terriglobales bacterium]
MGVETARTEKGVGTEVTAPGTSYAGRDVAGGLWSFPQPAEPPDGTPDRQCP